VSGTPQKEYSSTWAPQNGTKIEVFWEAKNVCKVALPPKRGKLKSNQYLLHFRHFGTPRKSTILDHFGVPKSMQKQGLQTNAPKSDKKRVPRVLRGCLGSAKGAAQERVRAPEGPRSLQRGSPLGGHEPTELTPALGRGLCSPKRASDCARSRARQTESVPRASPQRESMLEANRRSALRSMMEFQGKPEIRNALRARGTVADIYIYGSNWRD
jgi:hypothetical protein